MEQIAYRLGGTLILIIIGAIGWQIAKRIKCPAAPLLGAMFLIGFVGMMGWVSVPSYKSELSSLAKVMCGVILGEKINRNTLSVAKKMVPPLLLASVWMVAISVIAGIMMFKMAEPELDVMTCLASSAAGGIAEMSIFAMSVNADVGVVAFFQAVRIIIVVGSLPFIAKWIRHRYESKRGIDISEPSQKEKSVFTLPELVRFFIVVFIFAGIGGWLKIPSPYMLGGMVGAAIMNIGTGKPFSLPRKVRMFVQLFLGISIGANLTPRSVQLMIQFAGPLLVSVFFVQGFSFLLAYIIGKMTGWDPMTTFLATAPGGSNQIIFIAEDVGADPLICGVFHTIRLLAIITTIPIVAVMM